MDGIAVHALQMRETFAHLSGLREACSVDA